MKITIYTVNDCQFSKQEKDYLTSHQFQYEEKNLEVNKEFLTEMLAISDNFAGTPVTKIEKDDGSSQVLKGFTQSEFDEALGLKAPEPVSDSTSAQTDAVNPSVEPVPASVAPPLSTPDLSGIPPVQSPASNSVNANDVGNLQTPVSAVPASVSPPVVEPPTQLTQDPTQPMPPTPEAPPQPPVAEPPKPAQQDPKLASILGNLQSMSSSPSAPSASDQPANPPATSMPSVPDPNFS